MQFSGSRLPENAINIAVEGASERYFLCKFNYGYADNALNSEDDAAIDISWAIDGEGNYVELPGVDFIKIYTGVNQQNGALGECSTEVMGVIDLHL